MSYWRIAWKNIRQRGLASSLTALSMALGVAVMVAVIVVHAVTVRQFSQDAQGYELIVGRGGPEQLVLSTVFHLGEARYTLPWSMYRKFVDGEFAELTDVAIPYCLGDSFDPSPDPERPSGRLYRVVATSPDLFDKIEYGVDRTGKPRQYAFSAGQNFRADHAFEAVLGSVVAAQSGVKVGDKINPTHGISGRGDRHDPFRVVGVLEPTGTANDRAVFVNLEGFLLLDGHALKRDQAKEGTTDPEEAPAASPYTGPPRGALPPATLYDAQDKPIAPLAEYRREVSAVLVKTANQFGPMVLTTKINKGDGSSAQAVAPIGLVQRLLEEIVQPLQLVLLALSVLIVVVASISILVSIYNSMNERKHDIAVMRALGASRTAVMGIVLSESVLLSLAGGVLGLVLGHALVALAAPYVEAHAGVRLAFWEFDPLEGAIIPALMVLAALAGLLPAVTAYRTDVAASLR